MVSLVERSGQLKVPIVAANITVESPAAASQAAVEAFRGSGSGDDQSAAMLSASVAGYDIADVRSLTKEDAE
jgi:hypothetical protein